jgi:hypothetical protein
MGTRGSSGKTRKDSFHLSLLFFLLGAPAVGLTWKRC